MRIKLRDPQTISFASWCDFYALDEHLPDTVSVYKNLTYDSEKETLKPSLKDAYIYNCNFQDMRAYDGGAIFSSLKNGNCLVEKCSFFNCTATRYTAAIRILYSNSSIITKACSQNGRATHDSFSSTQINTKNSVYDTSLSRGFSELTMSMSHISGHVQIKSVNASNNVAGRYSSLYCNPNIINEQTHCECIVCFCSFMNNTSNNEKAIFLSSSSNIECCHQIKNVNVVNNQAKNTISCQGNTYIIDTCIINNKNPCLQTWDQNTSIFLKGCYIDSFTKVGSGQIIQITKRKLFIFVMPFLETYLCENIVEDGLFYKCPTNMKWNCLVMIQIHISSFLFILFPSKH